MKKTLLLLLPPILASALGLSCTPQEKPQRAPTDYELRQQEEQAQIEKYSSRENPLFDETFDLREIKQRLASYNGGMPGLQDMANYAPKLLPDQGTPRQVERRLYDAGQCVLRNVDLTTSPRVISGEVSLLTPEIFDPKQLNVSQCKPLYIDQRKNPWGFRGFPSGLDRTALLYAGSSTLAKQVIQGEVGERVDALLTLSWKIRK
jgi:hypothetical protein